MDSEEVLLVIKGYQRRTEDLDDLLAHFTGILLGPNTRNRKSVPASKLHRIQRAEDPERDGDLSVQERDDYLKDYLARIGAPV